jgi:TonB family protein
MIASWMIYIVLVGAAVTVAAAVVENALRATSLPARVLWVAAICFPVVVAIASARLAEPAQTPRRALPTNELPGAFTGRDQLGNSSLRFVPSLNIAVSPGSRLAMLDLPLLGLWMTASLLALGVFGGAAMRLRRIRSAAELRDIEGVQVSVTPNTGPLVVGGLHPQILIPRWVLELDRSEQQLIVAHEQEHLRGRDPALLAFSALVVVITPWNPFLWYMLRRLGRAVELDCDRRVLAERPDMRAYTGLLLSVASRSQSSLLPLAGLAASTSSLEERFRAMTTNPTRNRGYRLVLAATVVVLLLVATAMMPRPIRRSHSDATAISAQRGDRALGRVKVVSASGPVTYKVYSIGGSVAKVRGARRARTDTLTESLYGGSDNDVFSIDVTDGSIHFVSEDNSSIHIEGAMYGASPAAWITATGRHIVVDSGGTGVSFGDRQSRASLASNTFFEFQVDTPAVVRQAVKPKYPDALKASAIGGEVLAQFVVDKTGHVDMASFKALKSTAPEFTAAVRDVLPRWKIDPAIMQGTKVSQLVQQAFEFAAPQRE